MKFVFALLLLVAVASAGCNELLHCDSCDDDTHCKSCPDGYILDDKKVCRFDCATKYGENCTSCTEEKCLCPEGHEWDNATKKCVDVMSCTAEDGAACEYCGKGYDLLDVTGKCSQCSSAFGVGCETCSSSKCLTVKSGYIISGAVAVSENCTENCPATCAELFPGCTQCDDANTPTACQTCADGAELADGFCQYKIPSCGTGAKPVYIDGELQCGNCSMLDEHCRRDKCNAHACSGCVTGFGVTNEGKCVNCTATFEGCALCSGSQCTKCRSSQWVLTPSGCFNQNPFEPEPEPSDAGLIAGIVVAVIVFVVLIIIAIYCIVTGAKKKGKIDPSTYEDEGEFEFKSQSVL